MSLGSADGILSPKNNGNQVPNNKQTPETVNQRLGEIFYSYYELDEEQTRNLPDFSQLVADKSGVVSEFNLDERDRDDFFGFRFRTTFQVAQGGAYEFELWSDDGSRLTINGESIIEHNGRQSFTGLSALKTFESGEIVELTLNYFEYISGQKLSLRIKPPGGTFLPGGEFLKETPNLVESKDPVHNVPSFPINTPVNLEEGSAVINQDSSNIVHISFEERVSANTAAGFRLVGGPAEIKRLASGSGTTILSFELTEYVLPDDSYRLLHWPELSDAKISGSKLGPIEIQVENNVETYQGNSRIIYVSTTGSPGSSGLDRRSPTNSIEKAIEIAQPGDFVLLKRGEKWDDKYVIFNANGSPGSYITLGAYGEGPKPIVHSKSVMTKYKGYTVPGATVSVQGDYLRVDNLHVITDRRNGGGAADDGIQLIDSKYPIVNNVKVEAPRNDSAFGIRINTWVKKDGAEAALFNNTHPRVINSEVNGGFVQLVGAAIWYYDGRHEILEGGLIENCFLIRPDSDAQTSRRVSEHISVSRGDMHGFIIRKNIFRNFIGSAIETFGSQNVIIEYNDIANPSKIALAPRGIKAGGLNWDDKTGTGVGSVGNLVSDNIIIRYNKISNILGTDVPLKENAIDTSGTQSGEIYGNVIHNIGNNGIKFTVNNLGKEKGWRVYNNTITGVKNKGIQIYTSSSSRSNFYLANNIVHSADNVIEALGNLSGKIEGTNNIFFSGDIDSEYNGSNDSVLSNPESLFIDFGARDFRPKLGSPARGTGSTEISYPENIEGSELPGRPNIGAY